ncbi:uncharacterized protein LOC125236116 [Leguminivora glycinivorella]|uniref:uncharacterized protein LOC125236116 n=1 Tax=Leguminivora glycinivorella TaxID=1035111 RepID=UPI0020106DB7|nr:uncharacterized protein LOC125236116 [Leguminivora glycinivorella]
MPSHQQGVFSLNYMSRIRFLLNLIASWPNQEFGGSKSWGLASSLYRCLLIILVVFNMATTISYLKKYVNHDLAHSYVNMMLASVYLQRLFLPFQKKYCLMIKRFVLDFHLIHHKHKSQSFLQVYERVNSICAIVTAVSVSHTAGLPMLYNGIPLYNNIKAGMFTHRPENATFQHSVYFDLPFDHYRTLKGYLVVFFYNIYVSYNATIGICMYDALVLAVVFHIWGHLNILVHDLKIFPLTRQVFTKGPVQFTQEDMFGRLKDIMRHHRMIKDFMKCFSEVFSIPLCYYLLFQQLSGCVLLLKCSSLDPIALGRYGLLTIMVFQQLVETSVIFELVNSKIIKTSCSCFIILRTLTEQ